MPSGALLLVVSALLASPLPPPVEVDRSPRELRAVDIAANDASFAIAVARRAGVFVTVDGKDPVRVFEWARQVAITPAWHGDRLLWLGHAGRGAKRRVELRAIGLDGADRGGPWVIEPDAGPPHDDTALQRRPGERCLAVTETDVIAVWTVLEGHDRVLRRRAVPRRLVEAP